MPNVLAAFVQIGMVTAGRDDDGMLTWCASPDHEATTHLAATQMALAGEELTVPFGGKR